MPKAKKPLPPASQITTEATSYLMGLFHEFKEQRAKYNALTGELHQMEARVEISERTLSLMREHLRMAVGKSQSAVPGDWESELNGVRFVGVRLADACMVLLQEHSAGLIPEELLSGLNLGMFRFRTSSPLREIHGAMLRQLKNIKKVGEKWVWIGGTARQTRLRLVAADANQGTVEKAPS